MVRLRARLENLTFFPGLNLKLSWYNHSMISRLQPGIWSVFFFKFNFLGSNLTKCPGFTWKYHFPGGDSGSICHWTSVRKCKRYEKQKRGQGVEKQENCTKSFPFFIEHTICSIAWVILRICNFITMYKTVFFLDSTLYIFMVLFCMKNICCLTGSFKLPKIRYCLLSASWTQPYSDNCKFSAPLKNCRQKK